MAAGKLSDELVSFLNHYFESIRQLEMLLFLRERRTESMSTIEVARAIYCNEASAQQWLEEFCTKGLLKKSTGSSGWLYQYVPGDNKLDEYVSKLSQEYKTRPVRVIDQIVGRTSRQMYSFMDAFKFKKGDRGNDT